MKVVFLDAGTLGEDLSLDDFCGKFDTDIYNKTLPSEIDERVTGHDVVVLNKVKIQEGVFKSFFPKLICVTATGFDCIDLDYCRKNGIGVCNIVGYSTDSVAQLTLSMVLSLTMHLEEYIEFVRNGSYEASGTANRLSPPFYELSGKTWGVIGLGNIGKKVAKIAEAFGCRVLANKRTPDKNYNCVSLEALCRESDIISIHTPLTPQTKKLIGAHEIALMKKNAILINVARGAVCDECALRDAILQKKIAGLGVDAYTKEPLCSENPLNEIKNYKNVILTPHMAWGAFEARQRCISEVEKNILSFIEGGTRNRVDLL